MNKFATSALWDCAILLSLMAISLGIWYYPVVTMAVLALMLVCGCIYAR